MRHMKRYWLLLAALLVMAAFIGAACGDDDDNGGTATSTQTSAASSTGGASKTPGELKTDVGVSATEITLGQHIVMSGNLASVYAPIVPALNAYFAKVNQEDGGICGRDIKLISEDDQYNPTQARTVAQKLAEQDKVAAFMGNLGTAANLGSAQYINDQKIPDLWIATGVPAFADATTFPWTTLYNPDYISEGRIFGDYVTNNLSGKSVAILYQNDDFGKSELQGFKDKFTGTVTDEESYESTATDINSQLANMRNSNPDVVFVAATPSYTAKVYAYMAQNSWKPQVLFSYVNAGSAVAGIVGGGDVTAGFAQIAGAISTNYILDPVADKDDPAIVEHTRIMGAFNGPPVGTLSVYAQAMAETMVKTLQIACDNGDMTRQGIMNAAESLTDFRPTVILPGISITITKTDHAALQDLLPVEVQADGTLKALTDKPISGE